MSLEALIEDFHFPLRKCQRSWAAESAGLGLSPPASSPDAQDGDLLPWAPLRTQRGSAEECLAEPLAFRRSWRLRDGALISLMRTLCSLAASKCPSERLC